MRTFVQQTEGRPDWATPSAVFDPLHVEFGFTLDVCASPDNTKVPLYFTEADDGLGQDWHEHTCWMNPPYGRAIGRRIEKAHRAAKDGATVVCLVPARTDTAWWHDHVIPGAAEVRFVRGRIRFVGTPDNAPFPSAVVVFRPHAVE